MSKKVAILEGDKSRRFGGVKYLRTDLSGGGTCEWVPESERKLTTKTVKKNGTYNISDEKPNNDGQKYYGFSQFTVNVKNSTTGRKNPSTGGDGNEYSVKPNEDTGMLEETLLPSSINITTNPTKTSYNEGESINIAGMVVKAYKGDGGLWEADGYAGGVIPHGELTIEPTIASGGGSGDIWTDNDGINAKRFDPFYSGGNYYWYESECGLLSYNETNVSLYMTLYNGSIYIARGSGTLSRNVVYYDNGGVGMLLNVDSKFSERFSNGGMQSLRNILPVSTKNPSNVSISNLSPKNSQSITVSWDRPEDGETLTDTFDITVASSGGSSGGNSGGNNSGGGGGSW